VDLPATHFHQIQPKIKANQAEIVRTSVKPSKKMAAALLSYDMQQF
jgi:hypothetical protein